MEFRVVIPVRYASERLPGKALINIFDKPMLQHVYERAVESGATSVVIATDDKRIREAAEKFGATVCMTSTEYTSGTERIAEAVVALGYEDEDIIVNVQGDEPLIPPTIIRQVAEDLATYENAKVATLFEPIRDTNELFNPNHVKVVINQRGYALYFSRAPIPWERGKFPVDLNQPLEGEFKRHVGIYAYRARFLQDYMEWGPSPLEELEKLEQLRVLWNAGRVHVSEAKVSIPIDVNTAEDLEVIRSKLKQTVPD